VIRNRPSSSGAALGRMLASVAEKSLARFPQAHERCGTCAFRLGTYPNRCWQTVVDAFGCLDIREPFHCHERAGDDGYPDVCAGYIACAAAKATEKMDHEHDHEREQEEEAA
jgi:hypothetical protein